MKDLRKTYRGYNIVSDVSPCLESAFRSVLLLKNRFGSSNKVFFTGFQGSLGRFVELPPPDKIDYSLYQDWKDDTFDKKDEEEKDEEVVLQPQVNFTF